MSKPRLLVVDDEKNVRASLAGVLGDEGYDVECVGTGEECLTALEKKRYDVVFLDIWLPGRDGIDILKELKELHPCQHVIMISGHGTIETAVQATKLGAFDFIEKPLSLEKVILVLDHALRQKRLEDENRNLRDFVHQETTMIGNSVPMQALRQQIKFAAPTEGRVLIYGENGTGKELVARLLHLQSHRRESSFVEVNCAAIPDELIETELFGTAKGAYTGATENRKGKFELADRGTLFLDEVGDMSLKTQAKVLRILEGQRFHRVGSNEMVDVDVRVIAATNKNLEEEIEAGNFREDLFFRLNVIPFEVPPLRDRKRDIPDLIDYFLHHFSERYGKPTRKFTPESINRLMEYRWPGNVRELKNTIERIVIMSPREEVDVFDLPMAILRGDRQRSTGGMTWQQAREEFEREFLLRSLIENNGNVSRTAEAIGMERSHLHRKLKAYEINVRAQRST